MLRMYVNFLPVHYGIPLTQIGTGSAKIQQFLHLQTKKKDICKKRRKKKLIKYALWELAAPLRTVRQALRRRTPWSAHPVRQPWPGCRQPATSRPSSLYMFTREGGGGTPSFTEKQRPWAWPSPWYGSCPAERQILIRYLVTSVFDPDWIRIQWCPWIRIRIRNPDPDLDSKGQKWPTNIENSW